MAKTFRFWGPCRSTAIHIIDSSYITAENGIDYIKNQIPRMWRGEAKIDIYYCDQKMKTNEYLLVSGIGYRYTVSLAKNREIEFMPEYGDDRIFIIVPVYFSVREASEQLKNHLKLREDEHIVLYRNSDGKPGNRLQLHENCPYVCRYKVMAGDDEVDMSFRNLEKLVSETRRIRFDMKVREFKSEKNEEFPECVIVLDSNRIILSDDDLLGRYDKITYRITKNTVINVVRYNSLFIDKTKYTKGDVVDTTEIPVGKIPMNRETVMEQFRPEIPLPNTEIYDITYKGVTLSAPWNIHHLYFNNKKCIELNIVKRRVIRFQDLDATYYNHCLRVDCPLSCVIDYLRRGHANSGRHPKILMVTANGKEIRSFNQKLTKSSIETYLLVYDETPGTRSINIRYEGKQHVISVAWEATVGDAINEFIRKNDLMENVTHEYFEAYVPMSIYNVTRTRILSYSDHISILPFGNPFEKTQIVLRYRTYYICRETEKELSLLKITREDKNKDKKHPQLVRYEFDRNEAIEIRLGVNIKDKRVLRKRRVKLGDKVSSLCAESETVKLNGVEIDKECVIFTVLESIYDVFVLSCPQIVTVEIGNLSLKLKLNVSLFPTSARKLILEYLNIDNATVRFGEHVFESETIVQKSLCKLGWLQDSVIHVESEAAPKLLLTVDNENRYVSIRENMILRECCFDLPDPILFQNNEEVPDLSCLVSDYVFDPEAKLSVQNREFNYIIVCPDESEISQKHSSVKTVSCFARLSESITRDWCIRHIPRELITLKQPKSIQEIAPDTMLARIEWKDPERRVLVPAIRYQFLRKSFKPYAAELNATVGDVKEKLRALFDLSPDEVVCALSYMSVILNDAMALCNLPDIQNNPILVHTEKPLTRVAHLSYEGHGISCPILGDCRYEDLQIMANGLLHCGDVELENLMIQMDEEEEESEEAFTYKFQDDIEEFELTCGMMCKVSRCCHKIAKRYGCDKSFVSLFYHGRRLNNNAYLRRLRIKPDTAVIVYISDPSDIVIFSARSMWEEEE